LKLKFVSLQGHEQIHRRKHPIIACDLDSDDTRTGKAMSTDMNSRRDKSMSSSSINSMDECHADEAIAIDTIDGPVAAIDGTPASEPSMSPRTHSN
jgi:hypothetical protein